MVDNKKTFVISALPTLSIFYEAYAVIFFIAPLGLFYIYFLVLREYQFKFTIPVLFFTFLLILSIVLVSGVAIFIRRYVPHKIVIDNHGIHYYSFLKKAHIQWEDIALLRITSSFVGSGRFELHTKDRRVFSIPNRMKEEGSEYPEESFTKAEWVYADETKKPIVPENCPLFMEILKKKEELDLGFEIKRD